MPNADELAIIKGLRTGGTERRRFENMLWQRFSSFIHWGLAKYNLSKDELRLAYDDAMCSVIFNIVTGRYQEDAGALLKTYAETIFHHKCLDRLGKVKQNSNLQNLEKKNLTNPQPMKESLAEMLPDQVKNAIEEMMAKEEQRKLEACLEKIGNTCKDILRLFASGYKDKEIADMLHYSSADVAKQTRYRCIEKLSQYYLNVYKHE